MSQYLRPAAIVLAMVACVVLYREWVLRNMPPLFLPLGFFETAVDVATPEIEIRDPRSWVDTVSPVVVDDDEFDRLAQDARASETSADVLVTGATFGGFAAALSAAGDGATTLLIDENDWKSSMRAEAANFAAQRTLSDTPASGIERALINHIRVQDPLGGSIVNVTPARVVEFFEKKAGATPLLNVLDEHVLVAMARNEEGKVDRALVRALNSTGAFVARFAYLIDGTRDGSGLAQAGVPTSASWDGASDVPEPGSLPPASLRALAEGYTMSGRFVPGIGKRLENGRIHLGILDRGFHGTFVPIADADPCWEKDMAHPFLASGSVVLRTRTIGCTARASFASDFVDSVEVFFVNRKNDATSVTVTMGQDRTVARLDLHQNPTDTFVRIGAFPVGPGSPLTFEFESVLPTDRLEGLIIRKLNTGSPGVETHIEGSSLSTFALADWRVTQYDAYVTSSSINIPVIIVDGALHEAELVGPGTYAAKGMLLGAGEHDVRIPDGVGPQTFTLVPVRPGATPLAAVPHDGGEFPAWSISPDRDADILLTVPHEACPGTCSYSVVDEESKYMVSQGSFARGSELVASTYPLGVVRLSAGKTYLLSVTGGYDERFPPAASPVDTGAALYAIDDDSVFVEPPSEGLLYDVWVRSVRFSSMAATVGSRERVLLGSSSDWQYVATEPLSRRGASAAGGGKIEVLAIPNVALDAYRLRLPASGAQGPSVDMPAGTYAVTSFGLDNPGVVTATDRDGSIQSLSFVGRGGTYHATQEYEHSSATVFTQSSPWPQSLVFYERIAQPDDAAVPLREASLLPMNPRPEGKVSRESRGTMLFDARPEGIAPVAIGTLHSPTLEHRIRESAKDAFLLLRMGKTNIALESSCDRENDPRCDMRRFVREPSVFGTVDGLSPSVSYPEGRRIEGLDTLSASGAYAVRQRCTTCFDECIPRTMSGSACLLSATMHFPPDSVVSVRSRSDRAHIASPRETAARTLPNMLRVMRRDKILGPLPTYFEQTLPPRDIAISLGMLLSGGHENVLAGSTTASATPAAAKALRLPTTELALGSVAGHAAAFSIRRERAPLWFILQSPDAFARLQRYLVDKGIRVLPLDASDALVLKAIQRRVLDGLAPLAPVWTNDGAGFTSSPLPPEEAAGLFGDEKVGTVRDALERLPGSPIQKTSIALFHFGVENGFLAEKTFNLNLEEIMALPLDASYLLKADYLLHTHR